VSAAPAVDTTAVLVAVARATRTAQAELDAYAAAGAESWDDTGIPPWSGALASVRTALSARVGVSARTRAGAPSRLLMLSSGGVPIRIGIALSLRRSPDEL
jgi:hypothetical protein